MYLFNELTILFEKRTVVVVFQVHFEALQVVVHFVSSLFCDADISEDLIDKILDTRSRCEVFLPEFVQLLDLFVQVHHPSLLVV